MLFWLFVILTAVLFGLVSLSYRFDLEDTLGFGASLLGAISAIVVIVMFICIICAHCNTEATIAENNTRYDMLVYQYENDIYDNDNDLGKRELMVDIQAWNEDVAYNKKIQRNFWLGIFYPNIYDRFEFIELDRGGN